MLHHVVFSTHLGRIRQSSDFVQAIAPTVNRREAAANRRGAASLECIEGGTLQIGENRLIIGLVKRVHVREDMIDRETLRIRGERFHVNGRMASPHWYCRTRDRFEMVLPK